ncbi:alpha-1,4-N-acetylglucosaminyltransferase-like [Protopterus annectens]|uniref:alpha-1,4-N-acetylglucosaminyltransferase-like n=1 Tax=Protopterus annectens TaxID=7888 RepID=UPI001CFA1FCD|nr:alpha-1,4-N-acetylglucosaminyltransferase-like [Protopterus annectens]
MNRITVVCVLVFIFALGGFYRITSKMKPGDLFSLLHKTISVSDSSASTPSLQSNRIDFTAQPPVMFVETTETLKPQTLTICAVESAARIYQDRYIYFFLRGLKNQTCLQSKTECPGLKLLTDFPNVQLLHLDPKVILGGTPLAIWYNEDKVYKEEYWIRITSDGYRLALMWKNGGLYFDTDVITIKKVPKENFTVSESDSYVCNAVLGFHHHHPYIMDCMTDFVMNYNGGIWGQQGPRLLTRVLKKTCTLPNFNKVQDFPCEARNVTIMHPSRFYPISWSQWKKYFEVWKEIPTFNDSYGLHLWNFMNRNEKKIVISESNTLVENLFKKYCPSTYGILINNAKS